MTVPGATGRVNQKTRTRMAILRAASELMFTGRDVSMPEIASAALVSEATAYRYFPDLATLLQAAMAEHLPEPADALASVAGSTDPAERIAAATEFLLRLVWERRGAIRAVIAATITRPQAASVRPGLRFGLIDYALAPAAAGTKPAVLEQLKRDLAVVVSAEALFSLTDLCHLSADEAIASAVHTAVLLTTATLGGLAQE
jgi:AcrR family transcriptional regulator